MKPQTSPSVQCNADTSTARTFELGGLRGIWQMPHSGGSSDTSPRNRQPRATARCRHRRLPSVRGPYDLVFPRVPAFFFGAVQTSPIFYTMLARGLRSRNQTCCVARCVVAYNRYSNTGTDFSHRRDPNLGSCPDSTCHREEPRLLRLS